MNFILTLGFWVFLSSLAFSQSSEMSQRHNPKDPNHWYPYNCCGYEDCEEIPFEAIEYLPNGWHIRYESKKPHIGVVDEFVRDGQDTVKPNEHDGKFHACWRVKYPSDHFASGYGPAGRMRCFWYPLNM